MKDPQVLSSDLAVQQEERQFRLLVQGVTDYAIYMLSPTGHVISWNPGAQRFKGYKAEEILGQHFARFYTEEDRLVGVPDRALQTAREHGRFESEGKRVRKDGSEFWAHVVIDAIRDLDGELIGFAKITKDITEQRESSPWTSKSSLRGSKRCCAERLVRPITLETVGSAGLWATFVDPHQLENAILNLAVKRARRQCRTGVD